MKAYYFFSIYLCFVITCEGIYDGINNGNRNPEKVHYVAEIKKDVIEDVTKGAILSVDRDRKLDVLKNSILKSISEDCPGLVGTKVGSINWLAFTGTEEQFKSCNLEDRPKLTNVHKEAKHHMVPKLGKRKFM